MRSRKQQQIYVSTTRSTVTGETLNESTYITERDVEIIIENQVGRYNDCEHWKVVRPVTGFGGYEYTPLPSDTGTFTLVNWSPELVSSLIPGYINKQHNFAVSQILSHKTPGFELLPNLAELDELFAMFSVKFLRDFNYGAVTWGIEPLIGDLKALVVAIRAIFEKFSTVMTGNTETHGSRPLLYGIDPQDASSVPEGSSIICSKCTGITRVNGKTTSQLPPYSHNISKALFLLDQLGVNPDLKTLWDLSPLSFVVDYFLPIGDLLESLHPRGWQDSSKLFSGFISSKLELEVIVSKVENGALQLSECTPALLSVYRRQYHTDLSLTSHRAVEWQAPSLREIFNVGFLSRSRR